MTTTTESTRVLDATLQLETDDQSTCWLANIFRPFLVPLDVDSGESQTDDRFDWRFLGVCSLKSSTYGISEVSFFQVFGDSTTKQVSSLPTKAEPGESFPSSPSTTSGVSTITDEGDVSKMAPLQYQNTETSKHHSSSMPIKNTIVMSLNTQVFKPSKRQLYYVFPCDAIVETVNETPPYELFCSFHSLDIISAQKCPESISNNTPLVTTTISPLDNQQGYTDIPSSSLLLAVTPDIKMEQAPITVSSTKGESSIIHLSLSGISQELYLIIKESVAEFETAYGKMIQLMKFHTEGVSQRHAELLVVTGNTGLRTKKSTAESKTGKGRRKGSYQQRQTSPRTVTATTITPTTSNLSHKAKLASSANDIDSNNASSNQSLASPPVPAQVATPSNSAPIVSSGTVSSTNTTSHRHNAANGNGRKCHYCGSKSTPMWRRGPEGAGTLCNACGVKWKHGKILCGKQSGSDAAFGSSSSPTPTSSKSTNGYTSKALTTKEQKKRKQHVELKIKKDKRIKIKEQQQQRLKQQSSHSWHGNGMILDAMVETEDEDDDEDDDDDDEDDDHNGIGSSGFSDDDDFMGEYDDVDDEDERMNHNIVAARHLTIHEDHQYRHNAMSTGSTPPQPQSRSRSMTTSAANDYMAFQQQQQQQQQHYQQQQQQRQYHQNGWSMPNGLHSNQQHQQLQSYPYQQDQQQHRPRRHTADISVLDQVPWGEFPLSMGVDAVEAATVLTLLKRS